MEDKERLAILGCGMRWAYNILTEVQSNHGHLLNPKAREDLHTAVLALGELVGALP